MRPQLMEDVYGGVRPNHRLTVEQRGIIQSVTRPQLQEDLYRCGLGFLGSWRIRPSARRTANNQEGCCD